MADDESSEETRSEGGSEFADKEGNVHHRPDSNVGDEETEEGN